MKNYSRQRDEIINVISQMEKHSTAEQIYLAVKRHDSTISRSTVYRNLNDLSLNGVLFRFPMVCGNYRYELIEKKSFHGHLICSQCGKIEEIYDKKINDFHFFVEESKEFKGSEVLSPVFIGICSSCKTLQKD